MLKNMPEEKKAACDRKFAAEYLKQYIDTSSLKKQD
jgi:hypothetical protein